MRSPIAIRTCVVCGRKGPKTSLLRLALVSGRDALALDPAQRREGRGAYVCQGCLPRLRMTKRLRNAFRNRANGFDETLIHHIGTP